MNLLFLIVFICVLIVFLSDSLIYGITPTPTSRKVKNEILKQLPESIDGEIYELGSGFGQILYALAHKYPTHKVVGFEKAKLPFLCSKLSFIIQKPSNASLLFKNFEKVDLSKGGLIFCYLYRSVMPKLAEKFQKELKAGTWVISHTFAFEDKEPYKVIYAHDLYKTPIYLYRI